MGKSWKDTSLRKAYMWLIDIKIFIITDYQGTKINYMSHRSVNGSYQRKGESNAGQGCKKWKWITVKSSNCSNPYWKVCVGMGKKKEKCV